MVNKQHIKDLKKNGYVIIENLIDDAQTEKVAKELDHWFDKTPACKGDFYGQGTTTRFGSLLSKAPSTQDLVLAPELTSLVDAFLSEHCDWYQLSLSQAVRIHPGAPMQPVHKDELMWPHDKNYEWMINVIWAIDDFKEENGATRLWPAYTDNGGDFEYKMGDSIVAEMPKGSVLMFLGSTRHCGGANMSLAGRTAIIFSYALGWLKQNENQFLAYPPEIAKDFPKEIQDLIGYRVHRPNLGGYEYNCPSELLKGERPEVLQAVDALPPHIQDILDDMKREDRWAS